MTDSQIASGGVREGLEGVVVTATRLSHVDGDAGRLIVAGHDVEQLAERFDFEQACALLWGASGRASTPDVVRERLAEGRQRAFERLPQLGDALQREHGMDALRAAMAHLPEDTSPEDVVGALAVFSAAYARQRAGLPPIAPGEGLRHAQDLLAMLGAPAEAARARALDAYLVTVIDHGLNASTFAARVVASTRSDLVSSVVAAIGALKGPLHGGAPGPVLDMLEAIGEPQAARAYLEAELDAGRRIMGMGHRVYRQRDPRAFVLERAVAELERTSPEASARPPRAAGAARSPDPEARMRARLALARAVEHTAEQLLGERYPERQLKANVEFYTALLLSALDVDAALFSPLFACARAAGWVAHFTEQQQHGRLIRPAAHYIGAQPTCASRY